VTEEHPVEDRVREKADNAFRADVLLSSARMDWCTPPEVLGPIRRLAPDGQVGLDPCASQLGHVLACEEWFGPTVGYHNGTDLDGFPREQLCGAMDGLREPWAGHGLAFANPPYGRGVAAWARKASVEGQRMRGLDQLVLLVAARTDTAWFREAISHAGAVYFWPGRIRFLGADAPAPFPSVLIYWGEDPRAFVELWRGSGGWSSLGGAQGGGLEVML